MNHKDGSAPNAFARSAMSMADCALNAKPKSLTQKSITGQARTVAGIARFADLKLRTTEKISTKNARRATCQDVMTACAVATMFSGGYVRSVEDDDRLNCPFALDLSCGRCCWKIRASERERVMTEETLDILERAAREPYHAINYGGRIGRERIMPSSGASPAYKQIVLMLIAEIRRLRTEATP